MKTLMIAFTLIASVFTQSSIANDGIVAPEVLRSFQSRIAAAKEVGWSQTEDFYKVQFALDGQFITAFYKPDGSIKALTRNINFYQLPVGLQTIVKNDYKEYWIADLFEVSNDEGTQYYATLENGDTKMILKSSSTAWSLFQKQRKD